jgi:sulfoxide reductase heme-binding subunit YedZ
MFERRQLVAADLGRAIIDATRLTRRLTNHFGLMLASAGICALLYWLAPSKDALTHWSFGTAYAGIWLLTLTLLIGPMNCLRGSRQPVSSDFRRDTGIWACIWGLFHTIIGLQVHLRGRMSEYFLQPADKPLLARVRHDMFGLANYTGLVAAIFVLVLAAISNDWSLRHFGAQRWKRVQQLNYVLFAIVIAHAIFFQIIEKRTPPFAFALGFLAATAFGLQLARAISRAGQRPC